jgi:hypothetical protein
LVSFIAIQSCDIEALFKNDNYGCTEIDEYKFYRWQNPEAYGGSSNLVGHLPKGSDQKHTCTFELIMEKVCVGEPINLNLRLVYYSHHLTKIGLSRSDLEVLGTYELYTKDDDWGNPFFKEEIPKAQITQDTHVWDIVMGLLEEAGDEQVVNMVIRIELSFPQIMKMTPMETMVTCSTTSSKTFT